MIIKRLLGTIWHLLDVLTDPDRWGFLEPLDIGGQEDPYIDRLELIKTPFGGIYLHHIHREDGEPDPHDHPWWFFRILLTGAYTETWWPNKTNPDWSRTRRLSRFRGGWMRRRAAHCITSIDGSVWSLIFTGPNRGDWGFYPAGQFVSHDDYTYAHPGRSGAWRTKKVPVYLVIDEIEEISRMIRGQAEELREIARSALDGETS